MIIKTKRADSSNDLFSIERFERFNLQFFFLIYDTWGHQDTKNKRCIFRNDYNQFTFNLLSDFI